MARLACAERPADIDFGGLAIALVPLLLVLGIATVNDSAGCGGEYKPRIAERDMATLSQTAEVYTIMHGRLPKHVDELVESELLRKATTDPWGNGYQLFVTRDGRQLSIRSAGPDGAHATTDDIMETNEYEYE